MRDMEGRKEKELILSTFAREKRIFSARFCHDNEHQDGLVHCCRGPLSRQEFPDLMFRV